ncbi:tricorn protease domain 2-containing protein [Xylona heveae TC161]|uniref:Tricorn protease domain 2-containing protein n=1 Tax=Xylona heveae (strain CBS 132557 / TC161) TaxID=1328760 RepID=A0A165A823_XYLHT|nr:tricorn protease domain 2-containing protein [Xylona heveae TC161]KZF20085.1 tricorn protease domain 2-containing protein [Xylona heveae TC161]
MSITSETIWASSPSTSRGFPTPLSTDPKGERIAYASNKSVFIRSIDNPAVSRQYTGHTAQTTVARFSPSGFYVASGDVNGTVRVWDCVGEGATKVCSSGEYQITGGRINDIAWDGDSQRIVAVGHGKGRFGHFISADSGNTVGEISGHSAQINCVAMRSQRPFRAATGSDDKNMVFYHGAPFKFNSTQKGKHSNFLYGVAFSPDGSSLVTVGADRKIWLYDGKTGEVKAQIGEGEHKGSIFGVSWAPDSKRFVTASADQTVKIWDAEAGKVTQSWRFGPEGTVSVPDHQVGVVWPSGRTDGLIISLNLDGDLNYLTEGNPQPVKVVQGHQKAITAAGYNLDAGQTLWTGSYEGRICSWDLSTGLGTKANGETHTNQVSGLAATAGKDIYSVGWDDTLRSLDASSGSFTNEAIKLVGQPKGVATTTANGASSKVLVATSTGVEIYDKSGAKLGEALTKFEPRSISASNDTVAVGGDDGVVHIFALSKTLEPKTTLTNPSSSSSSSWISALTFSPDGSLLAAGNASGKIVVYKTADWSVATNRWSTHTARITSIAWNPDSTCAVSGSLDTNVFVWSVASPEGRVKAANAHKDGVSGVAWVAKDKVISAGADAAVKVWKVEGVR